jgi:hypothetical protein
MRIITNAQNQLTKIHIIFKTKNNLKEKNTNTLKIPSKVDGNFKQQKQHKKQHSQH